MTCGTPKETVARHNVLLGTHIDTDDRTGAVRRQEQKAWAKLVQRVLSVLELCHRHLFQGACFVPQEHWQPICRGPAFNRFCAGCLDNTVTTTYCRRSILSHAYQSLQTGEPYYSRCWLGLNTVTVAVAPKGRLVGAVELGGFHFTEDRDENRAFIEANLKSLGTSAGRLFEAESRLSSMLPRDIRGAAEFLFDSLFSSGVNSVERFRENREKYLQQRRIGELMQSLGERSTPPEDVFDLFSALVFAFRSLNREQSMLLLDDFFCRTLLASGANTDQLKARVQLLLSLLTREAVVTHNLSLAAATARHYRMYRSLEQLSEAEDICHWAFKQVEQHMDRAVHAAEAAAEELDLVPRVLSWIETNFWKKATLAMIAGDIGASTSSIVQNLREKTGQTFRQHLTVARMNEAKYLLAQTTVPLADVALRCGFYDQSHFCRTFQRAIGQSPGRFRSGMKDTAP